MSDYPAPLPVSVSPPPVPVPASSDRRRPVFADLQARWLLLAVAMVFPIWWVADFVFNAFGVALSDDLVACIAYLPPIAWLVWAVRSRGLDLRAMLARPRLGWYWLVVAGLGVSLWFISAATVLVSDILFPISSDDAQAMAEAMTASPLLLAIVSLVVLPPIVEELVFRGALFERWNLRWRAGVALLASAAVFGLLHADIVGAAVFGLVVGLLYLRTGSLLPGMALHALNNGAVLLLARMPAGADIGSDYAPTLADLPEALTYLAIGVPLVLWFVISSWPRAAALTPYEAHEAGLGVVPDRHLPKVTAIGATGRPTQPQQLTVTATALILRPAKTWGSTRIPLAEIVSFYRSRLPIGDVVVVVTTSGNWLALRPSWRSGATAADLAELIMTRLAASRVDVTELRHESLYELVPA